MKHKQHTVWKSVLFGLVIFALSGCTAAVPAAAPEAAPAEATDAPAAEAPAGLEELVAAARLVQLRRGHRNLQV